MMKTNPALALRMEFGVDIFGNKYNIGGGLTDELILLRARPGRDARDERRPIRRGKHYEAAMLSKVVINDQTETKLVHVESQASILIADEDGDMMNTEVGVLSVQAKGGPVRMMG